MEDKEKKTAGEKAAEETEEIKEVPEETAEAENEEKTSGKEEKKHRHSKELKQLQQAKAELEKKLEELDDRYKRLAAEYDNFRKRSAKEKEGAYTDAYADALKELLPVMDNIERAGAFVSEDAEDNLSKGVRMTSKQFAEAIERMGVESFGEPGEQFDPNLHNAVMHEEDETKEANVITEVFMKGYKRGDKVIRYAMVKTAN